MPPPRRSVVNVWLQGCSDCMPAFDAMAQLESEGGLNVEGPVINVAYGEADQAWARRYGVATNLVFDPAGAGVVKPLGIGTFTTLVVDPDGTIIHRDRPDRPGYVARVRSAMHPSGASGLDSEAVQRVVATNRAAIKRACWERAELGRMPTHVGVTVTLTIGTDGSVTQSASEGDDHAIANCIEMQARRWRFPSPATVTTCTASRRGPTTLASAQGAAVAFSSAVQVSRAAVTVCRGASREPKVTSNRGVSRGRTKKVQTSCAPSRGPRA